MVQLAGCWPIAPCSFYTQEYPVQTPQKNALKMSNNSHFQVGIMLFVGEQNYGDLQRTLTLYPNEERWIRDLPVGKYWINVYYQHGEQIIQTKVLKSNITKRQGTYYLYVYDRRLTIR